MPIECLNWFDKGFLSRASAVEITSDISKLSLLLGTCITLFTLPCVTKIETQHVALVG